MYSCNSFNLIQVWNHIWSFNITTQTWNNTSPANTISAVGRRGHSSVKIANNEIIYTSGFVLTGYTNEVLKFNPKSNSWSTLAAAPFSDNSHAAVYDSAVNEMIVYQRGEVYVYEILNNVWRMVNQTGLQPVPFRRDYPTVAMKHGTREMLLFGGNDGSSVYNDLWKYDIVFNTWVQLVYSGGQIPSTRYGHCMVQTSRGDLVIFGGQSNGVALGDTWILDMVNMSWTQIGLVSPSPRYAHRCEINDEDEIYLFAGREVPIYNDLWKLKIQYDFVYRSTVAVSTPVTTGTYATTRTATTVAMTRFTTTQSTTFQQVSVSSESAEMSMGTSLVHFSSSSMSMGAQTTTATTIPVSSMPVTTSVAVSHSSTSSTTAIPESSLTDKFTAAQIGGIIVGVLAGIAIVAAVVILVKRKHRSTPPSSTV